MEVLALASYPVQAAATRYRLQQFVDVLAERGITLTIRPFLDAQLFASLYVRKALPSVVAGLLRAGMGRFVDVIKARKVDVLLVQREAMIFGPPVVEWLSTRILGCPMVLDLDDATYVAYTSPTYGKLGKALKWFSKTDDLIRWAKVVTCGNRAIAEYAESKGALTRIIPTVVDTDVFVPKPCTADGPLVLGWIGTHSTFPYLRDIFPVLQDLVKTRQFKLRIVGAGANSVSIPGVEVENLEWKMEREVEDFQSFDIGLYPINPSLYAERWAAGKSGFKAIQYMAVGIPFVAAPVGVMAEIGEAGRTHFHARTNEEWLQALGQLLSDRQLRETMGATGRSHVVKYYSLSDQADKLASALHEAAGYRKAS
jgi:glycosyltransferase involved in cell wall biosynthesis